MALYFITGNKNKFAEIQSFIPEIKQLDMDLPEIQELDAHTIIEAKLTEALKHLEGEFIVEDTSLYFDGLNGLPGPLIKWFLTSIGNEGLAALVRDGNTKATARTIIGYAKNKDDVTFFEGEVEGAIVPPRGESNFGWNPIFIPIGETRTFAEMTREEKTAHDMNMRKIAAEKLRDFLQNEG